MSPKSILYILILVFFCWGVFSFREHKCTCEGPSQLTQTVSTKGSKNDAKIECDIANQIAEDTGGSCNSIRSKF